MVPVREQKEWNVRTSDDVVHANPRSCSNGYYGTWTHERVTCLECIAKEARRGA